MGPLGLSSAEVDDRRRLHGANRLPTPRRRSSARQLVSQFGHFFAILLWIAAALAFVGGLPQLGVAIAAVVVLNGVFAFAQEHRAERAADRLRDLVPRRVVVIRDGRRIDIDATELVPDDLVVVASGDRISADLRVVQGHRLVVDESILTGESLTVSIDEGGTLRAGTFLVEGEGVALVTATGSATALGEVAQLTLGTERPPTPLARELKRLVRTISVVAVGVGSVFFLLMVLIGTRPSEGFVFAVGVTVALVPEGLLPTVTLALSVGAQRMAAHEALVRRLESVETLGSTTFICTDKTGTLTENRMNAVEVWTPTGTVTIDGRGYEPVGTVLGTPAAIASACRAAGTALQCSSGRATEGPDGWVAVGDPMEAAIHALALRLGVPAEQPEVVARFPFDPRRRLASAVTALAVDVKGAPDAVVPRCRIDSAVAASAEEVIEDAARRGLRLLAVAGRPCDERPVTAEEAEQDLDLYGLLSFHDPPRPGARDAIERCRSAGISVAMITGDHELTALSIADAVGLRLPGAPVLSGDGLPADDDVLAATIDHDGVVISRVTPADKLRIARALQLRGHVVAMTGDGVNDGPALREADIGIAMGRSGTDVAREAADLVLLDDDFATIVDAVRLGRATFVNARQFLTYHLTDNVAELSPFVLWALSGGRFPLALGVLQILALDLGTDTLSAAALGAEPPANDVLDGPPVSGRLLDRQVAVRSFGVLGPVEAAIGLLAFLAVLAGAGWRPGDGFPEDLDVAAASGATFATVVLAQTANAFACRSGRLPAWGSSPLRNRLLLVAVTVELAFACSMLLVAPAADFLDHRSPTAVGWLVAALSMPTIVLADAAVKAVTYRRAGGSASHPERPDGRGPLR